MSQDDRDALDILLNTINNPAPVVFNDEADELEFEIIALDTSFELGEDCVSPKTGKIVSDPEYDALRKRLKQIRPESKVFKDVTASKVDYAKAKKVKHDPPMTSIDKASGDTREDDLSKWMADCVSKLKLKSDEKVFVQSYKHDGVAVSIEYEKGKIVRAGLRPRGGIEGLDVTEHVKHVRGVPVELPLPISCAIRGELECLIPDFEKLNAKAKSATDSFKSDDPDASPPEIAKVYANPRNLTAGTMQHLDPTIVAQRGISFTAYSVENLVLPDGMKMPYETEIERAKWCNKVLKVNFVQVRFYRREDLESMEENIPNLPYEVDGVVISVNDLEDQEHLGRHGNKPTGNPRGKIAWKFDDEVKEVKAKEIFDSVGRTGGITPVAITDPVALAGTMVRNFSIGNYGLACRYDIRQGTIFGGYKSGKIIPTIKYVKKADDTKVFIERDPKKKKKLPKLTVADVEKWGYYPKQCPVCGKPTILEQGDDGIELVCENASCEAQVNGRLLHYLTLFGVKGIGESQVDSLRSAGLLNEPADFYRLTTDQLQSSGLSERESLLALAAIHMIDNPSAIKDNKVLADRIQKATAHKKKIPLAMLFASFGVSGAGKEVGKLLVDHFGDFAKIRAANELELMNIPGIGPISAKSVRAYFDENADLIDNLLEFVEPELPYTGGKLNGILFCFSGGFPEGKKHWEQEAEKQSAKVSSSISTKTQYLVTEESGTKKNQFAQEHNIPVLSLDDFKKML